MAEQAKTDDIDSQKCLKYAIYHLGSRLTPFYTSQAYYATETANLAKRLFLSRQDGDYLCSITSDEINQRAQEIWAATLLSHACQASDIVYDDICDIANPEVAGYLKWVLPDRTISLMEGVANILSQLGQRNTYATCGPIFAVLSKAFFASERIEDGGVLKDIPKQSEAAIAVRLWIFHNTLEQLWRAGVYQWSSDTQEQMVKALKISRKWKRSLIYPDVQFHCGETRHCVDWRLDMSVPHNYKEYKRYR